jgi:hypothetical protein
VKEFEPTNTPRPSYERFRGFGPIFSFPGLIIICRPIHDPFCLRDNIYISNKLSSCGIGTSNQIQRASPSDHKNEETCAMPSGKGPAPLTVRHCLCANQRLPCLEYLGAACSILLLAWPLVWMIREVVMPVICHLIEYGACRGITFSGVQDASSSPNDLHVEPAYVFF